MYEYKAKVQRVVDGDTLVAIVDLGFGVFKKETVRFARIDAYETSRRMGTTEAEKKIGLEAKAYVKDIIEGKDIVLRTFKQKGKYGRFVADILYGDPQINLNDELVIMKYAVYKEY